MQQEQSGTVAETTAAIIVSLELESIPGRSGVVVGPVSFQEACAFPAVITLHSALYSRVHISTISEVQPAKNPGETRHVRSDEGKKHKIFKTA
jgi:hypothetical protein